MLKFSYDMSWCEASSEQMKDEEEGVFWLMSAVPGSMEWNKTFGVKNRKVPVRCGFSRVHHGMSFHIGLLRKGARMRKRRKGCIL